MNYNTQIGKLVYSKSGRDAGRYYIVISVLNEEYVYICDGDLRKLENPKKKKIKHLRFFNFVADDIRSNILLEKNISNSQIKKFLQSKDFNKEV